MKLIGVTTVTPHLTMLSTEKQGRSIFFRFRSVWYCKVVIVIKRRSKTSSLYSSSSFQVHAVNREEPEFEFDVEKARRSLRKLDEELESLASKKQTSSPKIREPPSEFDISQAPRMKAETSDNVLSESFLTNAAISLILFSIFYNIIFLTVIKPSIDGPDEPVVSSTFGTQ
ncbi:hypothetical protein Leryth_019556 [Lithospermum erythrorhizon]|nr:hypothetical protein Leryth_019556 [Lithospermum erythrorhizon]